MCFVDIYLSPPHKMLAGEVSKRNMTCRYLFVRNGFASTIRHRWFDQRSSLDLSHRRGSPTRIPSPRCLQTEHERCATRSDVSRGSSWSTRDSFLMGRESEAWIYYCNHGNFWVFPVILPPTRLIKDLKYGFLHQKVWGSDRQNHWWCSWDVYSEVFLGSVSCSTFALRRFHRLDCWWG